MQLCFVSVHGPRKTYFVDEPRSYHAASHFGRFNSSSCYLFINAQNRAIQTSLLEFNNLKKHTVSSRYSDLNCDVYNYVFRLRRATGYVKGCVTYLALSFRNCFTTLFQ
jgi:hypothetical protein